MPELALASLAELVRVFFSTDPSHKYSRDFPAIFRRFNPIS